MTNHVLLIIGFSLCLLSQREALAQPEIVRAGLSSSGLCGLALTAFPSCPKRVALSAGGGYGYTESVGTVAGAHHRLAGSLGVGAAPRSWLALALRFDGRWDRHPDDADGSDSTGTGEPRLFLRSGYALTPTFSLGGEAVLWFPGSEAPSFEPRAVTSDFKALFAYSAERPLALLGYAGFRVDYSANSAPELARVRPGDRAALGLSDSHAVLLALGASARARPRSELFCELSLDWLVGEKAPRFAESPLRATLGARVFLSEGLQGELSGTAAVNRRPKLDREAALVPIEPRAMFNLGLRYGFALSRPPPPAAPPAPEPKAAPEPTSGPVEGVFVDAQGAPVPDVRVVLRIGAEERETITDGEGRYRFADVPLGAASLEASAPGFAAQRWELDVRPDALPDAERTLTVKGETGSLRVVTRSFASEPLAALVSVRDPGGKRLAKAQADAQGLFEIELPPGRYVVMISAPGYRRHRREVQIERYGVAILNVDMREQK